MPLPVCPYDGHCYRKNPDHFKQYAHPKQSFFTPPKQTHGGNPTPTAAPAQPHPPPPPPPQQKDTPADREEGEKEEKDATPPRQPVTVVLTSTESSRSPSREAEREEEEEREEKGAQDPSPVQRAPSADRRPVDIETAPPSPEQLLYYITHAPRPDLFCTATADASGAPAPPRFCPTSFHGVGRYLAAQYGHGMTFPEEDLRAVLLAAVRCRPADPAHAFPGCRLVGPLALALRQWQHLHQHQQQQQGDSASASCAPSVPVVRFRSEDAKWRYARFRHDPIECQTVLLLLPLPLPSSPDGGQAAAPAHVAYHRDEPTALPSMLVSYEGGYYRVAASGLAPYLLARLAELGAAAAAASAALETAMREVGLDATPARSAEVARAAYKARQRAVIAPTINGLGIVVPYDKATELGYRPLTVSEARLKRILPTWDEDYGRRLRAGPKRRRTEEEESNSNDTPYTDTFRHAMEEQLCYLDMANDEGDYGLGLQVGQDILGYIVAPTAAPPAAAEQKEKEEAHVDRYSPLLWNAYRLLDTAYMCLNRALYRVVLRAHVPVLAGQAAVLLEEEDVFTVVP